MNPKGRFGVSQGCFRSGVKVPESGVLVVLGYLRYPLLLPLAESSSPYPNPSGSGVAAILFICGFSQIANPVVVGVPIPVIYVLQSRVAHPRHNPSNPVSHVSFSVDQDFDHMLLVPSGPHIRLIPGNSTGQLGIPCGLCVVRHKMMPWSFLPNKHTGLWVI